MRKTVILFFVGMLLIITGTFFACDKDIVVTLENDTTDTLFASLHMNYETSAWPSSHLWFDTIPPFSSSHCFALKSHLEIYGYNAFVARKSVIDSLTLDVVIVNRLYDTVYRYSYNELDAMDFIIKVRQQDLNVH